MEPLLHINWNITYRCPLDCAHCYSRGRAAEIPELDLDGKLALADRLADAGVFSVNLGGGEPIFSGDVPAVIRRLSGRNVWTTLCTSGWRVGDAEVSRVAEAGLKGAFVSLDDDRPAEHDRIRGREGCFGAAIDALRLFRNHGVETSVSTVVTRRNLPRLGEIAALAESLGARAVEFKRLKPQGNASGLTRTRSTVDSGKPLPAAGGQANPLGGDLSPAGTSPSDGSAALQDASTERANLQGAASGLDLTRSTGDSEQSLPTAGRQTNIQSGAFNIEGLLLTPEDEARLYDEILRIKTQRGIRVTLIYGTQRIEGVDEGCPCGRSILTVLSDGTVAPCVYNPEPIGNVLVDDLLALWASSPALTAFRERGTCPGLALSTI